MNSQEDTLLTPEQVMQWLGVKKTKIHELLLSGEIASYKIGKLRRIRREDVETWLEGQRWSPRS